MDNRLIPIYRILAFIIVLAQYSCSLDDNSLKFREDEKKWKECYDDHFHFQNDSAQLGGEFLRCIINNQGVLINEGDSGYQGDTYYESSGTVTSPDITLSSNGWGATKYAILITFFENVDLTGFWIKLGYTKDSLNYIIQKTFSNPYFNCATNLVDNGIEYYISSGCRPNGRVKFSTFYSSRDIQQIKIDSFTYMHLDGIWYYHLEYSTGELELTNERLYSKVKPDSDWYKVKYLLSVENLHIKNLHALIDFELPDG